MPSPGGVGKTVCPACQTLLAKEDRRRRAGERLVVQAGVTLEQPPDEALRLKCWCGCVVILVEGKP